MLYGNEKVMELLKGVGDKTGSPVVKEALDDSAFEDARCAAEQLFREAMEEYCEGEMGWKEVVDDLTKNLLALEMPAPTEEQDEEEDGE